MLAGSEPASGSVSPKQPMASPVAIRGSHSSFCASDPCFQMAYIASDPCTETSDRTPGVGGLELEAGQAVRRGAGAGAAVAVEVHPEQTHLAQLERELAGRQRRLVVPLGDVRTDLGVHQLAHGALDRALLLADEAVEVEQVEGVLGRAHALIASSSAASTSRAASGRALWPIRPIRHTVAAYWPTPAPISMPCRSSSRARTAAESTPSGTLTVVSSGRRYPSAANSSRPSSCRPSWSSLPASWWRAQTASRPSSMIRTSPACRLTTIATGAVWW